MKNNENIGQWTAVTKRDGKTPQLFVNGIIPTNDEKPIFRLKPLESDPFNPTQLILILEFGSLVDEQGKFRVNIEQYNQALGSIYQYDTVLVLDDSSPSRILSQIDIVEENIIIDKTKPKNIQEGIRGLVKVMTVPKEEREFGRREAFIQFDSFPNVKGNISQEILGKAVFAVADVSNSYEVVLSDITLTNDIANAKLMSSVGKEKLSVFGTIYKENEIYRFVGGTYRLTSMDQNLKKLKNKRIFATGSFAQFHTENGYFEAFLVEEFEILNSKSSFVNRSTANTSELIHRLISGSEITILKTFPPTLSINACGENLTTGWGNDFELSPYYYITPPEDGVYEFNFIGTPPNPNDVILDVLTPCFANYFWNDFPNELKGVRIFSMENSIDLMIK